MVFSRSQATVLSTTPRSETTAVSRGKDEETEMTGGFLVLGPFHVYILSLRREYNFIIYANVKHKTGEKWLGKTTVLLQKIDRLVMNPACDEILRKHMAKIVTTIMSHS